MWEADISISDISKYETAVLDDGKNALVILDQTKLPGEVKILELTEQKDIWNAINSLQVRGAPAIGAAAAVGLYLAAKAIDSADFGEFYRRLKKAEEYLASARPTAVNLFWALDRMLNVCRLNKNKPVEQIKELLRREALAVSGEDAAACRAIGEYGLSLIHDGDGILTHCNAGRLAAIKYGTALAPIYLGQERGYNFRVFSGETRPLLQGARLTAFELYSACIDVTVICDNMASQVMKNGWVQAVFVGSDRIAANGDVCNKIGTSGIAVLAKYYNIPFYVCAPVSTIDMNTETGADIPIEQRPAEEVTEMWYKTRMAPPGVKVYNPAFDVTDSSLITAIITERGIIREPYGVGLERIAGER